MRRLLASLLLVAASLGVSVGVAAADSGSDNGPVLSYDFSDNSAPASVSGGAFNVIVDVLPEHTPGLVKVTAIAPDTSSANNIVCGYQSVQQSEVECAFNFTDSGVWSLKAVYVPAKGDDVAAVVVARVRVAN